MNKEEIIRIRVTKEFKESLVKRAKKEGLTMSKFIREKLKQNVL